MAYKADILIKEIVMEEGSSRRSVQPQNEDTVPLSRTVSLL